MIFLFYARNLKW